MKKLYGNTQQEAPHKNLRRRMGVAFVSGCLALSMCPALAMAQPGGADGAFNPSDQPMEQTEQMGQPPAAPEGDVQMPQGDFDGSSAQQPPAMDGSQSANQAPQAPGQTSTDNANGMPQQPGQAPEGDGNQGQQPNEAPADNGGQPNQQPGQDNQAPQGQPGDQAPQGQPGQPRTDELDAKVLGILESYGIELPSAPNADQQANGDQAPGNPGEAPELPEGAVNVQQVIDTMRDILHEYSVNDLETNMSDETFVTTLKAYAQTATAQRLAMFASQERPNMETPSDLPAEGDQAPEGAPEGTPEASAPGEGASDALLSQICSLIMDVFGYVS